MSEQSISHLADRITNPTARSPSAAVSLVDVSSMLGNSEKSNMRYQKHDNPSTNKRRKHSSREKITLTLLVEEADSSNDDGEESRLTEKRSSTGITPSFVGHRVIASPTHSTHRSTVSSMTQQLLAATWKLESQ